ncbi:DUF2059 domain-containing protein [Prosthecomicrobium sp. N25]|uniref:DUF2059 domain-containing protein n=1 Tax=Prosthecomicrobium sp. N25 TaxID=3129254 RepID=UPI0030788705
MIRSIAKTLLAAGVCAVLATGALAQQAPQPEPSKEHLASARAAIEASRVTEGFDNILLGVAQQTKALFQRSGPSIAQDIEDVTNKVALELAPRRIDLDRQIQIAWASKFTKPELDEIAKFYTSPTGKKLAAETQSMVRAATEAVVEWQQKLSTDMVAKVRDELRKKGHKL